MNNTLHMITFRCSAPLFERLEALGCEREVDRTSLLKLALHYFLNLSAESPHED